jgi:hypothetical protein
MYVTLKKILFLVKRILVLNAECEKAIEMY